MKTKSALMSKQQKALEGIETQAQRMLKKSAQQYPEPAVGDNVKLRIPDVDKTRVDLSNLLAVVMKRHDQQQIYKLGTRAGVLEGWYTRTQFTIVKETFLEISRIPNNEVELRKAAAECSLFGGQGVSMCNCTTICATKTCGCRKKGLLCNSRCHKKNAKCINK